MGVLTILCKNLMIPLYFNVKYCTDPTVFVLSTLKQPFSLLSVSKFLPEEVVEEFSKRRSFSNMRKVLPS